MDADRKKSFMIGLLGVAALLWSYHFTRIDIEFPESHTDGLLVCSEDEYDDFVRAYEKDIATSGESYKAQFLETLANSEEVDSQVMAVAAKKEFTDTERTEALANLIQLYPDNKLGNLLYLNNCAVTPDQPFCDEVDVETANAVNQDNAISWALLAVYRAAQDDDYGVDRAMARAANAPQFEDYFGVQIGVLRNAIPPRGDYLRTFLIWELIGGNLATLTLNTSQPVADLCGSGDALSVGLHQPCISFGERMQFESKSTIMRLMGAAVQQVSHEVMGNSTEATRLEQEYLSYSRNRMSPGSPEDRFNKIGNLLIHDVDLSMVWLENLAEHGEGATAMENTLAEAKRRSADPDYAPCKVRLIRFHYR